MKSSAGAVPPMAASITADHFTRSRRDTAIDVLHAATAVYGRAGKEWIDHRAARLENGYRSQTTRLLHTLPVFRDWQLTRHRESLGNPRTAGELNDRATRKARVREVQIRA